MDEETQVLHDKLYVFIKEAIPILKRVVDISSLPTLRKYCLQKDDGRIKIVPVNKPNWYQIQNHDLSNLSKLQSLKEVKDALYDHKPIVSLDNKQIFLLDFRIPFSVSHLPGEFLKQFIDRADGLKFGERIFEKLFIDFLNFINLKNEFNLKIIAPLDNFLMDPKIFELDSNLRIRKISLKEEIDILNNNPILGSFYGSQLSPWFRCILEFDVSSGCQWESLQNDQFPYCINDLGYIRTKVNQEIVLLRAILNSPISSPITVKDYRGWNSHVLASGPIVLLPWMRPNFSFAESLRLAELNRYKKIRQKFIDINDKRTQQQIFVAMRKLAFSFDRPYGGDVIMDLVSGLEGLLVGENDEVGHKFSERAALLLESNLSKRKALFKDMKNAYVIRSKVAHGSIVIDELDSVSITNPSQELSLKEIPKFNKLQELRPKMRENLHKAIKICIESQTTKFDWDSAIPETYKRPSINDKLG